MDPLAAQLRLLAPTARAGAPAMAEAGAVLREGRVLSAEVLERLDPASVLLAIGRHRVAATSSLDLAVGQRLALQVESEEGSVVLRVLAGAERAESALLGALRSVAGADRSVGRLLGDLAARLRALAGGSGSAGGAAGRLASELAGHVFRPGTDGRGLLALLARGGLGYEAALLASARGGRTAGLEGDLKARLLRALADLGAGPAREAVERALAGIESEQLLHLARREAGDPLHLPIPFPDGDGWTTAHLWLHPSRDEEGSATAGGRGRRRLVLGVELSALGAVRAEIAAGPAELHVHLVVETVELARRMRAEFDALSELLGGDGRRARLSVGVGPREAIDPEGRSQPVSWLEENRLLDVAG